MPGTVNSDRYVALVLRNVGVFVPYLAVVLPLGHYIVEKRGFAPFRAWLRSGEPATDALRMAALRYPKQWALRSTVFWLVGGLTFTLLNIDTDAAFMSAIATTAVLGGVTSCALQYLLVEGSMRPVVAAALAGARPPRAGTPGVAARVNMAWALGTGVPLIGIVALGIVGLVGHDLTRDRVIGAAVALAVLGFSVGLLSLRIASKSVAEPLIEMRDALVSVETGDLSTTVAVDDGSEVGLLQAGFNRMVSGLREREQLREAFGSYVDPTSRNGS